MSDSPAKSAPTLLNKMDAWGNWIKNYGPGWRAFLIAVLLLILLDLAVRDLAERDMESDSFYIPWRSAVMVREYAAKLAEHDGPLAVVLGDSTLQPLPHLLHSSTMPFILQDKLRHLTNNPRWKVANFGLSGAHMGDLKHTARLLPDNVSLALITVNYKFLGVMGSEPVFLYPKLGPAYDTSPVYRNTGHVLNDLQGAGQRSWRLLESKWFLLSNGEWAVDRLFGDRLGNWLRRQATAGWLRKQLSVMKHRILRRPLPTPSEDRWTAGYIQKMNLALQAGPLNAQNKALQQLAITIMRLRQRNIPVIVYTTPLDWSRIEAAGLARRDQITAKLEHLAPYFEQTGAIYLNLVDEGNPDWFIDMDHLTIEGRNRLADLLITQVAAQQRKRLGRRP